MFQGHETSKAALRRRQATIVFSKSNGVCNREAMKVAVVGANGFVGRELSIALVKAKYDVIALSRHAPEIAGATGRSVDVADAVSLQSALAGCEVAFYLVHSLSSEDFRVRDRQLAEGFGRAAAAVGLRRIVYLGGLGDDPSSEHLASRQEVGVSLASGEVPVVELRAAVVLGAGSISFEMLRYLTERLPFMVCPRWVRTAIQPIASTDMIRYLIAAIDVVPGVYEVGGADVTSYREMISAYAEARGLRHRRIVDVPYLTPRLSSYWLDLVTPVDRRVSNALIESLGTEVVVQDQGRTDAAFNIEPMGLGDALLAALDDQALALDHDLLSREDGLKDGIYTVRVTVPLPKGASEGLDADLSRIGGSYGWYGLAFAWRVRAQLGRVAGEYWSLKRPPEVVAGAAVDWWLVARRDPGVLILSATHWIPGEAWLGYECTDNELVQVGSLRPKGIPGFLYWKILQPVHRYVFRALARYRVTRAK
jgi:uncharacterized protein YbjT (DUF2867 family)